MNFYTAFSSEEAARAKLIKAIAASTDGETTDQENKRRHFEPLRFYFNCGF